MPRRLLMLIFSAVVALQANAQHALVEVTGWADSTSTRTARLDAAFWDLALPTTDGDTLRLADLRGRHVLLNFWGEWCGPCYAEMPALVEARRRWSEDDLFIVGMLRAHDLEAAHAVRAERGLAWPQVLVTDDLAKRFGVIGYPTNLLVLPDGETALKAYHVGPAFFERYVGK